MISQTVLTRGDAGNKSVLAQVEGYYQNKKDDYYARDSQPSRWHGKAAQELGFEGAVQEQEFIQALKGVVKGKELRVNAAKRNDAKDRLGIDMTFNAPKSVSIQALVGGDKRLIEAHNQAVAETLARIEQLAQARRKQDGKSSVETTGNLAIATFRHDTNRNNDPHLHTHSVILNFTRREDGEYRALHNEKIIKSTKEMTMVYQASLAKQARELGYDIRLSEHGGFELAHISREQIEKFSSRSQEIEAELAEKGLSRESASGAEKQTATLSTRQRKQDIDLEIVQQEWVAKAEREAMDFEYHPVVQPDLDSLPTYEVPIELEQTLDYESSPDYSDGFDEALDLEGFAEDRNSVDFEYPLKNGSALEEPSFFEQMQQRNSQSLHQVPSLHHVEHLDPDPKPEEKKHERPNNEAERTKTTAKQEARATNPSEARSGQLGQFESEFTGWSAGRTYDTARVSTSSTRSSHAENAQQPFNAQFDRSERASPDAAERADSVRNMPSVSLVQDKTEPKVPLSAVENDLVDDRRAYSDDRLRRDSHRFERDGDDAVVQHLDHVDSVHQKRSDQESLQDIMRHDVLKDDQLQKWQDRAKEADLNLGQVQSKDGVQLDQSQIFSHVIEHLTDKKVELSETELKDQVLKKGLGLVNATDMDAMIQKAVEDGDLIITQQRFKPASDRNDHNAKTVYEWVENIQKMNTPNALEVVTTSIESGRLVSTDRFYTTRQALQVETQILEVMEQGKQSKQPIYQNSDMQRILAETTLNEGQKAAAAVILSSQDRVVGVQGYAGTGKSYMLKSTLALAEKRQAETIVVAPYGAQVKSLRDDGIEANTLASFLMQTKKHQDLNQNSVIVVDEAGVVSNKQMRQLLKIAEAKNAKVVLLGDTAQTKAIEGGKPFDLLQRHGMTTATMSDIQRQKDPDLKQAVLATVKGQQKASVSHLKNLVEVADREQRHQAIAAAYSALTPAEREKTIVVSGRNVDRRDINDRIRENLGVKGTGIEVEQLRRVDMSAAELKHVRYYKEGQFIELQGQSANKQLSKDETYQIFGKDQAELLVKDSSGRELKINPTREKLAVFESVKTELAVGDVVRVTKGDKEKGTVTGDRLTIIRQNEQFKDLIAEDSKGNRISFDGRKKLHLDHAYVMTVHAAQGLTVDRVMVNMDNTSKTTSKEVYYVAISRAKHRADVYTDSIEKLPAAIQRGSNKQSAVELVGLKKPKMSAEQITDRKSIVSSESALER